MRTALVIALAAVLVATLSAEASAKPKPGAPKKRFSLFAGVRGAISINRVYCGLNSAKGEVCVDSLGSSTIGGGFWPKGTADQYVFNSGLQLAGTIGPDGPADWVGNATGAFFFDPKGTTEHGEGMQSVYNSTNPDDFSFIADTSATCDNICLAAKVPTGDATQDLFNELLRGRAAASQGDIWFMTWEGSPGLLAGRPHPLGIAVETRGMGWNYPAGNQDIIYLVYTFYNVTSSDPAVYAGVRPGMRELLAEKGAEFQRRNEQSFGLQIPDGGYTINNLFAAFATDPDVAEAGANYASVNVPFALGFVYEHTFSPADGWTFDPRIFSPPFFPGSGFFGVKYLKSPELSPGVEAGLTLYSNTINGGAFDDAQNTIQLFRYLSNGISPAAGDAPCNTGNPANTRICFVNNTAPDDMRFFQSSGPLNLGPGQFGSIVVAYIFAAPVATGSCSGPGTCDLTPGDPTRLSVLATAGDANPVDSVAGYRDFVDDGDGVVEQTDFRVVPGSLMGKALVAQAVFDNRFLLPFAPESPQFFLVPGDNQVTVLWRPSTSEDTGDPFFAVASAPTRLDASPNPLFDPNYRQFDVEGYRIYRGRVDNPNELSLLAQYDYRGTFMADFGGQVNPVPTCAPEIGINTECAAPFDSIVPGVQPVDSVEIPLVGQIVQVKRGERAGLATGEAILLTSDTAITGRESGCLEAGNPDLCSLRDTGVPFAFTDRAVRNSLRYFYTVTAFDINSFQSGPSSIESPRVTKAVTPVALAANYTSTGTVTSIDIVGRGRVLNPDAPRPTIDPAAGTFSGPFPPSNGWSLGLAEVVSQVLGGPGALTARLDSIQLGSPYQLIAHQYWFTASAAGSSSTFSVPVLQPEETGVTTGNATFRAIPVDPALASRYGGDAQYRLPGEVELSMPGPDYLALYGRGCVNARDGFGDAGDCAYNGSRWFPGPSPTANEVIADPIGCNTGNFSNTPMPCFNNAGGGLAGVTTIHQTQCYQSAGGASCRPVAGIQSGARRAADFNVYWGAGGLVDSVIDATHNVPVPFDTLASGGWGILNQAATAVGPGLDASATVTNADFACVEPFRSFGAGGFICPAATAAYRLSNTAVPGAVGFFSGGGYPPGAPVVPAAGAGFALYIAGDMFTFELTGGALPADGAVWALRTYAGAIVGGQGAGGDFGPYAFSHPEEVLPLTAVGVELQASFDVTNQLAAATDDDLSRVHTVPDPYYVTNQFEQTTTSKVLKFVNLPADAIIRIYSSSGVLVTLLEHHSSTFGGEAVWNVRNRNDQVVASGVYFYHIEAGDARKVGRFTVVNFAQ